MSRNFLNSLSRQRVPLPSGKSSGLFGGIAVALGLVGFGVYESIYNVEAGHRAIMFNRLYGVMPNIYPEGTHFRIPWFEWPVIFDCRAKPLVINSTTGSRDLQVVQVSVRVLSRPRMESLPRIYRTLGQDYDQRVLPSVVNEILKAVVAQYTAAQLLTQREAVSKLIREHLVSRATDFDIILDDVSLTHLAFSKEFTAAIEAKQVAAQEAERARILVEKAEQDKKGTIIRAQGEAQSADMIGTAMKENPAFLQLRQIEAAREIAQTVAKSGNAMYLSADSLLLNLVGGSRSVMTQQMRRQSEEEQKAHPLEHIVNDATVAPAQ